MRPEPTRVEPIFSPRIWGALSLAPLFPEKTNLAEPLGEAWLTGVDCKIATGPFTGKSLGEAWREMPADWRGTRLSPVPNFPLLVKFIFPKDKLSIQVHPDDAYASLHEKAAGGRGKTEMWYVVSAEPGARLLAGLKPDVTKSKFLDALARHSVEDLLQSHEAHAGDTFFIRAGTAHTIGPNMVICEVQEYSDLTYRVYDYDRVDNHGKPRELHIQKALEVIRFGSTQESKIPPLSLNALGRHAKLLCACRYFAAEWFGLSGRRELTADPGHFQLLVVLSGRGNLNWAAGAAGYKAGECWMLPASLDRAALHPSQPTTILRAYVPDLESLPQRLQDAGIAASNISQSVFA